MKAKRKVDFFDCMQTINDSILNPSKIQASRRGALTTEFDGITVDTVKPTDTGIWETGIEISGNKWVIVEQYDGADQAKVGHEIWVETMKNDPNKKLKDIYLDD